MEKSPMVVIRAVLVGGIAIFAKVAGAMKAAGGAKVGAATAAMTAAAAAAMGSKQEQKDASEQQSPK